MKLSSEMRQRLEKVTANHSVRSTKTTEKPALPREDGKVKRLEDNRKLLLEQQLGIFLKNSSNDWKMNKHDLVIFFDMLKEDVGTIMHQQLMTRKASLRKVRPT